MLVSIELLIVEHQPSAFRVHLLPYTICSIRLRWLRDTEGKPEWFYPARVGLSIPGSVISVQFIEQVLYLEQEYGHALIGDQLLVDQHTECPAL